MKRTQRAYVLSMIIAVAGYGSVYAMWQCGSDCGDDGAEEFFREVHDVSVWLRENSQSPRNSSVDFFWLEENVIGGLAAPTRPSHMHQLRDTYNVGLLVTLQVPPLDQQLCACCPAMQILHLPVNPYAPLSHEQITTFVAHAERTLTQKKLLRYIAK